MDGLERKVKIIWILIKGPYIVVFLGSYYHQVSCRIISVSVALRVDIYYIY